MSAAKKRRTNFTAQEVLALVEGVQCRKDLLFNSLNNVDTKVKKKRAWTKIADEESAVSRNCRKEEEVRKNVWH